MKLESKCSIRCLVCGHRIRTNKDLTYNWQDPINMNTNRNVYMVHIIRRHCQKEHPHTPVWNAVAETKFNKESKHSPIDQFIHHAMRAGGFNGYVPKDQSQVEFKLAFISRVFNAMRWVQWHVMSPKRLKELGIDKSSGTANDILNQMLAVGVERISSKTFLQSAETSTLEQLFNTLMLFFFEMGRFKTCTVFGRQDLSLPSK